jgi:hypothetical protein
MKLAEIVLARDLATSFCDPHDAVACRNVELEESCEHDSKSRTIGSPNEATFEPKGL